MTDYAGVTLQTSPAAFADQYARQRAQSMANLQAQQGMNAQNEADKDLPGIFAALASISPNQQGSPPPQPPMPGQSSAPPSQPPQQQSAPVPPPSPTGMPPSGGGMPQLGGNPSGQDTASQWLANAATPAGGAPQSSGGGPGVSRLPGGPQQPQNNSAFGGYDLSTIVQIVKQQYPNISGGALRNILGTMDPYLLTPQSRFMLARLGISQENANTNQYKAGIYGDRANMQWANQFDPTGTPPMQPPIASWQGGGENGSPQNGGGMPAPQQGGGEPQPTPNPTATSAAAAKATMSGASATGKQQDVLKLAEAQFNGIADDALKASDKVSRSSWLAAGQFGNWLKSQTNDPDFVAFQNYNQGLVREYGRAFGGTVAAQSRAEEVLNESRNPKAYKSAVQTLQKEMADASKSGDKFMKKEFNPQAASGAGGTEEEGGFNIDAYLKEKGLQ